jgi:hypothetical protein
MESGPETDVEGDLSVDDILTRIREQARTIEKSFEDTFERIKAYRESLENEDANLIAKPRMKIWLEKRQMPPIVSFSEFFEVFLEEHKEEGRLDIGTRTIDLREDARDLFRPKLKTTKIHILDFLGHLDQLFE